LYVLVKVRNIAKTHYNWLENTKRFAFTTHHYYITLLLRNLSEVREVTRF